jgi:hypothetical protein
MAGEHAVKGRNVSGQDAETDGGKESGGVSRA